MKSGLRPSFSIEVLITSVIARLELKRKSEDILRHVLDNASDDDYIKRTRNSLTNINLSTDGRLTFTYNTKINDEYETLVLNQRIKWINSIRFSQGNLTVVYNDNSTQTVASGIKWISNVSLNNQTGIFKIQYNDSGTSDYTTNLQWPTEMSVNTGFSGNQKLHVRYTPDASGNPRESDIGEPINYILATKITESDHHLIILQSDPIKRAAGPLYHNGQEIDGYTNWTDLGSVVSDRDGVLVGLNLTWEETDDAITYLNTTYPNGLQGTFLKDKIVTVGSENQNKFFFGFNYDIDHSQQNQPFFGWYLIGQLAPSDSVVSCLTAMESDSIPSTYPIGSLWFVVENIYNITYTLTNTTSSNTSARIVPNRAYTTTLIATEGNLSTVSVTMGGTEITSTASNQETGVITISNVTGDVVITAISSTT